MADGKWMNDLDPRFIDPKYGPKRPEYVTPGEEAARDLASRKALQDEWRRKDAAREEAAMKAQELIDAREKEEARISGFIQNQRRNVNPYDANYNSPGETKLSSGAWIGPEQRIVDNLNRNPDAGPREKIAERQVPPGSGRHERNFTEGMSPQELEKFRREHGIMPR